MVRFTRPNHASSSSSSSSSTTPGQHQQHVSTKQMMLYTLLSITSYYIGTIAETRTTVHPLVQDLITLQNKYSSCVAEKDTVGGELERIKHEIKARQMEHEREEHDMKLKHGQNLMVMQEQLYEKHNSAQGDAAASAAAAAVKDEDEDAPKGKATSTTASTTATATASSTKRFQKGDIFQGMAKTSKQEFMTTYDFGSPIDNPTSNDVLLFYTNTKAMPNASDLTTEEYENLTSSSSSSSSSIQLLDTTKATRNCNILHVATIPQNEMNKNTCFAIVENYNNQLTQKWMRKNNIAHEDLVPATRGQTERGRTFRSPNANQIARHWAMLQTYLNNLDDVLKDLKPIAAKVGGANKDNTIIVMTCNMGQSELLMNFVCNAKAKGFDLDSVLVFPTDVETKDLAEGLGLATFHDDRNFGKLPKGEAKMYGDKNFAAMMFAKVLCVQLISHLGYDLLFQDVDVVWYKNPLEYFHDPSNPYHDFDMYFQDDGAHSVRYAPYSANSGFYYVRNNEKTKYTFTSLLYHSDMILESGSHQEALIQVLANHASWFGLRVKVLSRDMEDFPGGWHYHRRPDLMRKIMSEEIVPEIFHMSWTKNKDNKVKFYKQIGQWYVKDQCIASTKEKILGLDEKADGDTLVESCCLAEPNIVCHYKDKPSKIPCKGSPSIDEGRKSFW